MNMSQALLANNMNMPRALLTNNMNMSRALLTNNMKPYDTSWMQSEDDDDDDDDDAPTPMELSGVGALPSASCLYIFFVC